MTFHATTVHVCLYAWEGAMWDYVAIFGFPFVKTTKKIRANCWIYLFQKCMEFSQVCVYEEAMHAGISSFSL